MPASRKHCLWRCVFDMSVCGICQGDLLLKLAWLVQTGQQVWTERLKNQTNSPDVEDTAAKKKQLKNWPNKVKKYDAANRQRKNGHDYQHVC